MKNVPMVLYVLAAVIWLVLGFLTGNVMYLFLSVVFFCLAYKNRKPKEK